jgi:hypothetical protein
MGQLQDNSKLWMPAVVHLVYDGRFCQACSAYAVVAALRHATIPHHVLVYCLLVSVACTDLTQSSAHAYHTHVIVCVLSST